MSVKPDIAAIRIRAEKAWDLLEDKSSNDYLSNEVTSALLDIFAERKALLTYIVELKAGRRWVPCSERLPEHDQYVDIWGPVIGRITHARYCFDTNNYFDGFGWIDEKVTHWMPLPSLPEVSG